MLLSSGTTALATTDDTAVNAIVDTNSMIRRVYVVNEGAAAGFFSVDGGSTWARLPAGPASFTLEFPECPVACNIKIKRIASGTNLSAVYVYATG